MKKSLLFPEPRPHLQVGMGGFVGAQKTRHKHAVKIAGNSSIVGGENLTQDSPDLSLVEGFP